MPTEPYVDCDSYYTRCPNPHCCEEVYPVTEKCDKCGQVLDWNWLTKLLAKIHDGD